MHKDIENTILYTLDSKKQWDKYHCDTKDNKFLAGKAYLDTYVNKPPYMFTKAIYDKVIKNNFYVPIAFTDNSFVIYEPQGYRPMSRADMLKFYKRKKDFPIDFKLKFLMYEKETPLGKIHVIIKDQEIFVMTRHAVERFLTRDEFLTVYNQMHGYDNDVIRRSLSSLSAFNGWYSGTSDDLIYFNNLGAYFGRTQVLDQDVAVYKKGTRITLVKTFVSPRELKQDQVERIPEWIINNWLEFDLF